VLFVITIIGYKACVTRTGNSIRSRERLGFPVEHTLGVIIRNATALWFL